MSDFWIGVLVPFAVVAGSVVLWLLYSLATWAWARLHVALIARIDLSRNPIRVYGEDDRAQYSVATQKLVETMVESPRFYIFAVLGWQIVIVRDFRESAEPNGRES